MNEYATRMKCLRLSAGVTLRKLGEITGKRISYLSDVECGRRPPPRKDVVVEIARCLGADPHMLADLAEVVRGRRQRIAHEILRKPRLAEVLYMAAQHLNDEQQAEILEAIASCSEDT